MSKRMYHPCHKLSVPSAKIFWCRHCMQMFEDAISRWKHSKVCRFYNGAKPKDQDGQVIQMYVKPDTVSYSQNFLPGQTVIHKPQIKKNTAELKCVICNTKFYSLYDMREHVKYPCQKAYTDSTDSDSDIPEESVRFKIRRVELDQELAVKSSTALSVLAEASKHVESLSYRHPVKTEVIADTEQQVDKCLQTIPDIEQIVEVAPVYPSYHQIEHVSAVSENLRQVPRLDLPPIVISIQTEDGQDLPEASLDEESILLYLREIIKTFQVGQVLEIHTKSEPVKSFVVGTGDTIFPAENPQFCVEVVKPKLSTDTSPNTAISEVPAEITDSTVDSSLLLALASEQIHGSSSQSSNTVIIDSRSQPQLTTRVEQVGYLVPLSAEENPEFWSQTGKQELLKKELLKSTSSSSITETEHSYQLPYSEQPKIYVDSQPQQVCHPVVQVETDSVQSRENLNQIDLQNFVTFIQQSAPEGVSCVGSSETSQTDTTSEVLKSVPVVTASSSDTEVNKTGNILDGLVCTYAESANVYKMAGEQQQLLTSASNWFGFAELTDDYVSSDVLRPESVRAPSASTSFDDKEVNHQRDENEIVVPISSSKSGITKYKVLARQKAEDDIPETRKTFSHAGYNWDYKGRNSVVKVSTLRSNEPANSVKQNAVHRANEEEKRKDTQKSTKIDTFKVQKDSGGKCKIKNGKPKAIICRKLKGTTAQQKQNFPVKTGTENTHSYSVLKVRENQTILKSDYFKADKVDVSETNSDQKQTNNSVLANIEHRQEQHPSDSIEKDVTSQNDTESEVTLKISEAGKGDIEETKHTVNTNCSTQGETFSFLKEHNNKPKIFIEDAALIENCGVSDEIKQTESGIKDKKSDSYEENNLTQIGSNNDKVENATECMDDKMKNGVCEPMDTSGSDSIRYERTDVKCVPLVNKCSVTLRRDPSIENFNKDLFDSSVAVKVNFLKRKSIEQRNDIGNKELSLSRQSSDSGGSICDFPYSVKRQKSFDDKMKVNMVYNADINVRKSGRLQSAKCASRYRGDYGIRADTYNKITSKKSETSVIDNESVVDKNELSWTNFETTYTDIKCDSVDGLVSVETESVGTGLGEIISNKHGTVQQVVDHRKHNKLKNEESEIHEQNDLCPRMKQMDCRQEVIDQISLDRSVESKCVSDKKSEIDASQANSHFDIFLDHTSEEFIKPIENDCSICDLSGIVTTISISPVPCPLTSNTDNDNQSDHICEEKQSSETLETNMVISEGNSLCNKKNEVENVNAQIVGLEKVSTATGYVHSVGKSVNKKQKYITRRSANTNNDSELFSQVLSPDSSPEKCNPSQVLETLRLRLFEKVGLSAQENDSKPKAFESKLISSKLKQSLNSKCLLETLHIKNEQKNISNDSINTVISSRKTPQGSVSSSSVTILEEVAKTLDSMQKAKRKNDSKVSKPKPKRIKFADKKFMLRSMSRNKENDFEITVHEGEKHTRDDILKDKRKPKQHSVDICGFETTAFNVNNDGEIQSNNHTNNTNPTSKPLNADKTCSDACVIGIGESVVGKEVNVGGQKENQTTVKIIRKKPKTVKCHSCFQTFRSKEVMRKHYPCRVRQTRTWSQNKLRPNRAFRSDTMPRKKVVNFDSKSNKSNKQHGKQRPQLLTPRKTKFRRVKGKRRRKLYQLIQDLISKRKIMDLPHLDVVFTDLSFKEQCMYRLGLFCVGSKFEGLENYSAEDLALFKEHQDKEKEFFLTRNFKHIFPPSDNESVDSNSDTKSLEPIIQTCDSKTVPSFTKDIKSSNSSASIQSEEPKVCDIAPKENCEAEANSDYCLCETQRSGIVWYEKEKMSESTNLNILALKDSGNPQNSCEVRGLINEILDDVLHRVLLLISKNISNNVESEMTESVSTELDNPTIEASNIDTGNSEAVISASDIHDENNIHIPETDSSNVNISGEVIQDNVCVSEALDIHSGVEVSSKERRCIEASTPAQHFEEPQALRDSDESNSYPAEAYSINIKISETTNFQSSRHEPKSLKEISRAVHSHHVNSLLCSPLVSNREIDTVVAELTQNVFQDDFSEKYLEHNDRMTLSNELNLDMMQGNLTDAHLRESENVEESLMSSNNDSRDRTFTGMESSLENNAENNKIGYEYLEQQNLSPNTCELMISETIVESSMIEGSSDVNGDSSSEKNDFQYNTLDEQKAESPVYENVESHDCLNVDFDSKRDKRTELLEKEDLLESLSEMHDHLNDCDIEDHKWTEPYENIVKVKRGEEEMKEINTEYEPYSNKKGSVPSDVLVEGKANVANSEEQNPTYTGSSNNEKGSVPSGVLLEGKTSVVNSEEQNLTNTESSFIKVSALFDENDSQKKTWDKDSESCPCNNYNEASDVDKTHMHPSSPEYRFCKTDNILDEKVKETQNSLICSDSYEDSKFTVNGSNSEMYISHDEYSKASFQDTETLNTTVQELYSSKLDESAIGRRDVADTDFNETVLTNQALSESFGEKQNLTSLIKTDTVIRYKINGVCINENVETGVKEIASEEFVETDIHIGSSQEIISESSIDEKSSCYNIENCIEREEVISCLATNVNISQTEICSEESALTEKRGNKLSHMYDCKDCRQNDNCVTLEPNIPMSKTPKSYESDNTSEKSLRDKENDSDVTFVEGKDNQNFAMSENHSKNDSEEIEVMRHGDDNGMHQREITLDCLSYNSSESLSVSLCENVELEDQSFSSTREDLSGSFRALEKDINIAIITKTETPPVLEKETNGMLEGGKENIFEDGETISDDSGPPVLEPVRKPRGERHFLDIIGEICENKVENKKDLADVVMMSKEVNDTEAHTSINSETLSDTSIIEKEDIGRHFSDVIDSSNIAKHQFNEMHMLFDKSERGEVTLATIKSLLKVEPKKGHLISKEKLLKIRSGVEHIIKKVKVPEKKDPSWLKSDTLLDYSCSNKTVYGFESSLMGTDNSSNPDILLGEDVEEKDYICKTQADTDPTTGSITDNILQMLTSLEDKGSFADNMTNLLDILAENLGFPRSHSRINDETANDSEIEEKAKDFEDNQLRCLKHNGNFELEDLDEEPPSLHDIPIADDFVIDEESAPNDILNSDTEMDDTSLISNSSNRSDQCYLREHTEVGQRDDAITLEFEQVFKGHGTKEPGMAPFENKAYDDNRTVHEVQAEAHQSLVETKLHSTDTKKAQTIFKSITELNSIETDDDSDSRETFDVAALSQRISELKYLSKDVGESDLDSDIMSDKDSSTEEVKTTNACHLQASIGGQSDYDKDESSNIMRNWPLSERSDVKNSKDKLVDMNSSENDSESSHLSMENLAGREFNNEYSQFSVQNSLEVKEITSSDKELFNKCNGRPDMNKGQFTDADKKEYDIRTEQNKLDNQSLLQVKNIKENGEIILNVLSKKSSSQSILPNTAVNNVAVSEKEFIDEIVKPLCVEKKLDKPDTDESCPLTHVIQQRDGYELDRYNSDLAESKESTLFCESTKLHARTVLEVDREECLEEHSDHFDNFCETTALFVGDTNIGNKEVNKNGCLFGNSGRENSEQFQSELKGFGLNKSSENESGDFIQSNDYMIHMHQPCSSGSQELDFNLDIAANVEKETVCFDDTENKETRIMEEAAVIPEKGMSKFDERSHDQKSEGQLNLSTTLSDTLNPVTHTTVNYTKDDLDFAVTKESTKNSTNFTDSEDKDVDLIKTKTFMAYTIGEKTQRNNELQHTQTTNKMCANLGPSRRSGFSLKPNGIAESDSDSSLLEDEGSDLNPYHTQIGLVLEDEKYVGKHYQNNLPVDVDLFEVNTDLKPSDLNIEISACGAGTEGSEMTGLPVGSKAISKVVNCEEEEEEEETKVTKEQCDMIGETLQTVGDKLNKEATKCNSTDLDETSELTALSVSSNEYVMIYNREEKKEELNTQNCDAGDKLQESLEYKYNNQSNPKTERLISDDLYKTPVVTGLHANLNENCTIDDIEEKEGKETMKNCNKSGDAQESEEELNDQSGPSHRKLLIKSQTSTENVHVEGESAYIKNMDHSDSYDGNMTDKNHQRQYNSKYNDVKVEEHTGFDKAGKLIISTEIECSDITAKTDPIDNDSKCQPGNFDDNQFEICGSQNMAEMNIARHSKSNEDDSKNSDHEDNDVFYPVQDWCTNNDSNTDSHTDHLMEDLTTAENLIHSIKSKGTNVSDNPVTVYVEQIEHSRIETVTRGFETDKSENQDNAIIYCKSPNDTCMKDQTEFDIKNHVQNISAESKVKDKTKISENFNEVEIAGTFSTVLKISDKDVLETANDVEIHPEDCSGKVTDLERENMNFIDETLDKIGNSGWKKIYPAHILASEEGLWLQDESISSQTFKDVDQENGFSNTDYATLEVSAKEGSESVYTNEDSNNTLVYDSYENIGLNDVSESELGTMEEEESPLKSTDSFSSLLHEEFCETIAEKVKRKQNERLMKLEEARDKYRCFYGQNQHPKEKQKHFSIFRSTMLQKKAERARKKLPEKDNDHITKLKDRFSSVPTNFIISPCSVVLKPVDENKIKEKIGVKPCSVQLERLDDRTLDRYKKSVEACEKRPPIRFKINLTKLCIKPCSPRPSYFSDPVGGNSTEEESEEEFSDESSGSISLRSTESKIGPQVSDYKIYEIKNSPRTFHKGLEEGKPIKIKVRSVPPQTNGSHQVIQDEDQIMFSNIFNNVTHENVSFNQDEVQETSSNGQKKDKFEPKWIKDLQLSESDTTELDSDTDCMVTEAVKGSDHSKEDFSVESLPPEVLEIDNTDSETIYQNKKSDNNDCMKLGDKLTCSDRTQVSMETENNTDYHCSEFEGGPQCDLIEKSSGVNETETCIIDQENFISEEPGCTLNSKNDQTPRKEYDAQSSVIDHEISKLGELENELDFSIQEEGKDSFENMENDGNHDQATRKECDAQNTVKDHEISESGGLENEFGLSQEEEEKDGFENLVKDENHDHTTKKEYDAQNNVKNHEISEFGEMENELGLSLVEEYKDGFENLLNNVSQKEFCESKHEPQNAIGVEEHGLDEVQTHTVKDNEIDEDSENIRTVLTHENDTVSEETVSEVALADEGDVIYYAVEVNDDFESDQAISNLEQLEVEQLNPDPEHGTVLNTEEIETSMVESMVDERLEIQESDVCENFVEISEASQILGHEEIVSVNEVEARASDITEISCVAVVEQRDKFVYGIDEDTQSPLGLVEECVMDCTAEVQLEPETGM